MKKLVGLVIVGMCMFVSVCQAEDIEANSFIKINLANGDYVSCTETDITKGCRLIVDDKFVTLLNKSVSMKSNSNATVFFVETYFVNHKFPLCNVIGIEYR